MHAVSSATLSRETAVATMRTCGFFCSSTARMPCRFPALPPMKACVGAGRSSQASGALPATIVRFSAENAA